MTRKSIAAHASTLLLLAVAGSASAQYSTPMRDVENHDRTPYLQTASITISPPFVNNFMLFPTPLGKRVVIEQIALSCTTASASDNFTQTVLTVTKLLSPTSASGAAAAFLSMERRGPAAFGGTIWQASPTVKAWSDSSLGAPDGGTGIALNIFHTDTSVAPSCFGTISGHLFTP